MRKFRVLALFLVVVLMFSMTACGKSQDNEQSKADSSQSTSSENVIKIAYLPITHSLAVLQEAENLSEDSGLKVELVKYGSWPELMDALNSGQVDGASVLIELAMKSKEQGIDLKAVALGHRDGNVVVVSNKIKNAKDMKGKTFAIPHRQSSHYILLNQALAKGGLTVDDVKITELAPTEMPSALASGQIDGYCVAEPFGAVAVSTNSGKVLYRSEELWENSICCALVLNNSYIKKNPSEAKTFVEEYKKAGSQLTKSEALTVANKYLNQSSDVLKLSLKWISFDNLSISKETYEELVKYVKKYKLSSNPPSYSSFVDNDL